MKLAGGKNFRISLTLKDCRKEMTPFLNLITVHFELFFFIFYFFALCIISANETNTFEY
jgi:hypothetical protein